MVHECAAPDLQSAPEARLCMHMRAEYVCPGGPVVSIGGLFLYAGVLFAAVGMPVHQLHADLP